MLFLICAPTLGLALNLYVFIAFVVQSASFLRFVWLSVYVVFSFSIFTRTNLYIMNENPTKLFDDILKLLAKDYNKIYTFEEIQRSIFPEDFNYNPDEPVFENLVLENPNAISIHNALMFLNKQELVAVNFDNNECFINTAGFIKIKTQGFQDEIEEKQTNLKLQRWTWIVLPTAAILTAVFAGLTFIFSLFKSCNV